jgi:hypothetical protein
MFEHFLRYVPDENWFLFLKHLRRRAHARNSGTSLDPGRVRFSIERQHLQTLAVAAHDPEMGSVDLADAGENITQTAQDGFYRGLVSQGAGRIE